MHIETFLAAALIAGAIPASPCSAQDSLVGARVRITTRDGFHYRGQLTSLDSVNVTVTPDDSTPATAIARSNIRKLERSLGIRTEEHVRTWAGLLDWAAVGAGAVYGARNDGGTKGAILDGLLAGLGAALVLEPYAWYEAPEERWEKVELQPTVRPLITSGAGGRMLLGVSLSFR